MKSSLHHTLIQIYTLARNLNQMLLRDKLLRRNLHVCLQGVTNSLRLFRHARQGLPMIKYFSHRHKVQRFEAGLKGTACSKTFQVILNSELNVFQMTDMLIR